MDGECSYHNRRHWRWSANFTMGDGSIGMDPWYFIHNNRSYRHTLHFQSSNRLLQNTRPCHWQEKPKLHGSC